MSTIRQIRAALATQLQEELAGTANPLIPGLTVDSRMATNPTPPYIDIYPGSPFVEGMGFGPGNKEYYFTVRARVDPLDHEGQQDLLDTMMDTTSATSVEQALYADRSLGGAATMASVEGPTEYGMFGRPEEALLGCTWRVRVIP